VKKGSRLPGERRRSRRRRRRSIFHSEKRDNQIEGDARKIRVGQYGHRNGDLMSFVEL
jgi:hypothetical protein